MTLQEHACNHFLASEFTPQPQNSAHFHLFPVPYEATVSYGGGASRGPAAVMEASQQLEIYVEGFGIPGDRGMYTSAPLEQGKEQPEDLFRIIGDRFTASLESGAFPIFLGGEHSITNGIISSSAMETSLKAAAAAGPDAQAERIGILQFDAHCDLRDMYQDSKWSHAAVMRRAAERNIPLFQVGIRNYAPEEMLVRRKYRIPHFDASEIQKIQESGTDLRSLRLPEHFPDKLFISFDVDAFDASLMPATGTPEPGGLFWYDALALLEGLTSGRTIIGADVVELAPIPGLHHCEYTIAKLVHFLMALSLAHEM